jgi:transglutaminase-like putative cysteine protease
MILEIQHETRLAYSEPVSEAICEVRMEPRTDGDQSCHSFHLTVSPSCPHVSYQDGFGNRVHHFNLLAPHHQVHILAASVVETHPAPRALASSTATYPLDPDGLDLEVYGYVHLRGPVQPTPLLAPHLERLRPQPGMRLGALLEQVCHYIHGHFTYAPAVTLANSPVEHLLREGKGVCQDFTHLMLALLRSYGVPARYVSGYLHRPNKDSQSHAWCEAWLPDLGWVGIDPTNDCLAAEHFVKVAVGRDFSDVPPNKGVYRGRGEETISVRVETRTLERLPSLSWQQQLPPLQVPLTAITGRQRGSGPAEEESQQQ